MKKARQMAFFPRVHSLIPFPNEKGSTNGFFLEPIPKLHSLMRKARQKAFFPRAHSLTPFPALGSAYHRADDLRRLSR